ncbi:MAG: hypothetical protein AB1898_30600 [Acidobacteriota bacterium]
MNQLTRYPDFADRLVILLTQVGMRPNRFAKFAGIPLETLEGCPRGELPDVMSLYRIARALDTTMEWLIAGEEEGF